MTTSAISGGPNPGKADLRRRSRTARAGRVADPVAAGVRTRLGLELCAAAGVVAVYLSRPDEPDTWALIDALVARGARVLVPVLQQTPDWAWYAGRDSLVVGPLGISQPRGPTLGADALAQADFVWLPGLAGTPSGDRLGTGGGWYDQALAWARPDAELGLLLFASEVLDSLPTDTWDRTVHWLVTEDGVIRCR